MGNKTLQDVLELEVISRSAMDDAYYSRLDGSCNGHDHIQLSDNTIVIKRTCGNKHCVYQEA